MTDREQASAEQPLPSAHRRRGRPSRASLMRLADALSAARAHAAGHGLRAFCQAHVLQIVAGAAVALVLAGLAVLPAPFAMAHALLIAGAALMMFIAHRASISMNNVPMEGRQPAWAVGRDHRFENLCDKLERRLEQLQDVHWEISESDMRYRDLLDQQRDVILRRDESGRLTFVNTAFSRVFGIEAAEALGRTFTPLSVATEITPPLDLGVAEHDHRYMELIETVLGQRWYVWDEHDVVAGDGSGTEVQAVGRDVTEDCRRAVELADARDQALSASRAKSRFLAAMSHEIRTPMNGIMGMASLLRETDLSEEQGTYVTAVDQSARVLVALIDEILDFSKIEAGKVVLVEAPFNLAETAQAVVELLSPRAHDKGLELALTVDPSAERAMIGDEARVRQILLNLLSNAVKFTDHGGIAVTLTARRHEDGSGLVTVAIAVEDSGIGLSGEDMRRLFMEFEQADLPQRRNQGGTGLGLAISKRLARAMKGDIAVTSTPGSGSIFTAEIVLRDADRTALPDTTTPVPNEKLHVLVAVGHAFERRSIAHILRSARYKVVEADAPSARSEIVRAAEAGHPIDRIIVDVGCDPGIAGALLEAAQHVARCPVIGIVTVNVLARSGLPEFRSQGYLRYLIRPVRARSLLRQLVSDRAGEALAPADGENRGVASPLAIFSSRSRVARAAESAEQLASANVLLVEDNEINALLARRVLEKCGCVVERREDGQSGVDCAIQSFDGSRPPFDLILMDIHMPGLDGIQATQAIREAYEERIATREKAVPAWPPIIALTANAFPEDRERCLAAGLDDYLAKPFDVGDLQALLHKWGVLDAPSPDSRFTTGT